MSSINERRALEAEQDGEEPTTYEARVSADPDGEPIGSMLFVTADDLEKLGIDLDLAETIQYGVVGGEFRIE